MTRYENAHQEMNLTHLADPLARIAGVLAEVSIELEQLSERVGAGTNPASDERQTAVSSRIDVAVGASPRYSRGEPVDTSFAASPELSDSSGSPDSSASPEASTAPAASAAGASPSTVDRRVGLAGWQRWRGRASPALWVASTILLLGIVLLLVLFTQR